MVAPQESEPIIESSYRVIGSDHDAAIAAAVVAIAFLLAYVFADRTPRWRSKRRWPIESGRNQSR